MRDSLGRETDHLTPCDDGRHRNCTDEGCDCNCHSSFWQAVARVPEVLDDMDTHYTDEKGRRVPKHDVYGGPHDEPPGED